MTFPELLDAALTGTFNHVPPTVLAGDDSLTPERRLLRDASYLGIRWLAGRPIELDETTAALEPAEPESLPEVPQAAAARLIDIMERRPEALYEWLQLVRVNGFRVPPICLPELLEYARNAGAAERELILDVGGARTTWLAKLNPAWQYGAYADPEEQFAFGSREDRPAALRRIRRREPDRARDLLQEVWRSEQGDSRARLLAALETRLSPADEDLLAAALGDARHEVRETALRLIRRLKGSRFGERWIDRAHSVVRVVAGRLVVSEPVEVDPVWVADGLDPRPPKGIGATAWLLQQVLALTPPHVWPPDILDAIARSDWQRPLLTGLAQAAEAYADSAMCRQLIMLDANSGAPSQQREVNARSLILALPASEAEELVRRLLDRNAGYALQLATVQRGLWSWEFSDFLVTHLRRLVHKHYAAVAALLREAPWQLDPDVLSQAEAWLDAELEPLWLRPALERLVATLDYRLAMRQELRHP